MLRILPNPTWAGCHITASTLVNTSERSLLTMRLTASSGMTAYSRKKFLFLLRNCGVLVDR
ncbi:MAG TPA: hypothetical protein VJK27_08820, partial [Terriglobales bacterium]|nr:hypothetical protein [Terriglobales bacterium]